jgi:FtsP/CotA-like multicopper oxidase with cupredoxin domain
VFTPQVDSDVSRQTQGYSFVEDAIQIHSTAQVPLQLNDQPTNTVVHMHGLLKVPDMPAELEQFVPLFCKVSQVLRFRGIVCALRVVVDRVV